MKTASTPDDFDPSALPENLGEEIQILTLNEQQLAHLQDWSARLHLTPEQFLLKGFDLLCARMVQAARNHVEITPGNQALFLP